MASGPGLKLTLVCSALLATLALSPVASAAILVVNFDGLVDGTAVSTQFAGLTFSQTVALRAGLGLNEFEFPPRSGDGVVADDGGAITIAFASPVFAVGGYFNYVSGLTFAVFDSSNNLLSSRAAAFGANLALSGDPGSSPNEFLSLASAGGLISRAVITGAALGGSFTLDDLTLDSGQSVPEPQTLALVLGVLGTGLRPGGWLRRSGAAAGGGAPLARRLRPQTPDAGKLSSRARRRV